MSTMIHRVKYLWTGKAALSWYSRIIFRLSFSWSFLSSPGRIHFPERYLHPTGLISTHFVSTFGIGSITDSVITGSIIGSIFARGSIFAKGSIFTGSGFARTLSTVTDRLLRQVIQVLRVFPFFKKSETNFCLLQAVH